MIHFVLKAQSYLGVFTELTIFNCYGIVYLDIKSLKIYFAHNMQLTAKLRAQKVKSA